MGGGHCIRARRHEAPRGQQGQGGIRGRLPLSSGGCGCKAAVSDCVRQREAPCQDQGSAAVRLQQQGEARRHDEPTCQRLGGEVLPPGKPLQLLLLQ